MDVLVKVPDNKLDFFMELVKNLKFKAEPKTETPRQFTPEEREWIDGLKESLQEVELHQQGKIKLKSARELLNEL
jgi:hypothetical protein